MLPGLAARARDWHEHMHYGLWRAGGPRPVPSPGLWCTDIATGISRYAEVPPDLVRALSRWAVWLGGAAPVDGIWRFTGQGMRLSPAEGDAAAQLIRMATEALAYEIAGKPRKSDALRRAAETMPFGHAEPHGVVAEFDDPAPPLVASLIRMTTGALLPRIVAEVCEHRAGGGPGDLENLAAASLAASDAKRWLDEPVPALRRRTPRQAAAAGPQPPGRRNERCWKPCYAVRIRGWPARCRREASHRHRMAAPGTRHGRRPGGLSSAVQPR